MKKQNKNRNIKHKLDDAFDEISYIFNKIINAFKFTSMKRYIKFFLQRRIRGFDDSEIWDLDTTFFNWILPRLKRFKRVSDGSHPAYCTNKDWQKQLNIAIENIEYILSHDEFSKEYNKRREDFLNWFSKNCSSLWW